MRMEILTDVLEGFAACHFVEPGTRYWFGRDLVTVTGARDWDEFRCWLEMGMRDCAAGGEATEEHFVPASRAVVAGPGEISFMADVQLSAYACFLVARVAAGVSERAALLRLHLSGLLERSCALFFMPLVENRSFIKLLTRTENEL